MTCFAKSGERRRGRFLWGLLTQVALLHAFVGTTPIIADPKAKETKAVTPGSVTKSATDPAATEKGPEEAEVENVKQRYWARGNEAEIGVVQNRLYPKKHRIELGINGSVIEGDPFLSVKTLGLSAGYHFSEFLGVHLVGWKAFVGSSSALKTLNDQMHTTTNTNEPKVFLGAEGRASILYGKVSLLGASILYFDAYLSVGGGLISTESGSSGAITWGLGQQFHLSRLMSLNLAYKFLWYRETILGKISGPAGNNLGQNLGVRGNLSNEICVGLSFFFDPFSGDEKK